MNTVHVNFTSQGNHLLLTVALTDVDKRILSYEAPSNLAKQLEFEVYTLGFPPDS